MAVTGVLVARALPAMLAGPLAGVVLDRFDRKRIMIASDLIRAVVAAGFIYTVHESSPWLLYTLSALLMVASPFFTSGRASILPSIASKDELHTANSLTQSTQWTTLTVGAFLSGVSITEFGYDWAFVLNAASFAVSALCISRLFLPGQGFRAARRALTEAEVVRPWHEYKEGVRYMRTHPLILGIALVGIGWATGGGAAQILFSVFGELVFHRGPGGIGALTGCAGIGLIAGATFAHRFGPRLSFVGYKRTVIISYVIHGSSYVLFSQMRSFGWALFFMALSRAATGVTSVLNMSQLLRHVSDEFRGRVFATFESMQWSVMMVSMLLAGVGTEYLNPRTVGALAGVASTSTALVWSWMHLTGRLPEPPLEGVDPAEFEIHEEPAV
jgi:MFS family permease